ncbi:DUF3572 domain-containing protein [Frigidibacter sp. SD6-1]|uniref:DUF3572 domain-containing protein n=1 Tax=Frigidibacter sp. SD6-1 TaxID=3032581 RepID=UPI0024DF8E57|nr:DUF3572 domain-containing protein [Frigidibacter sp. SD6-1]
MTHQRESAEVIAAEALAWLAGQDELLAVFMGASGITIDEMRQRAAEPEFLAAVLDFLLMDDAWITGFCDAAGLAYDQPRAARAALPGAALDDWA